MQDWMISITITVVDHQLLTCIRTQSQAWKMDAWDMCNGWNYGNVMRVDNKTTNNLHAQILLTYFHLHIYKVSILHTDFRYHHNYVFLLFINHIIIINMKIRYKLTIIYLALKWIITHTVMILLILWILNPIVIKMQQLKFETSMKNILLYLHVLCNLSSWRSFGCNSLYYYYSME